MMYAPLIRHEWEMKGWWDLDKWLPLFHQLDRSSSICSNLNDNKILNCFVLAGHFLHDKQPGKVTLSCNPDSQKAADDCSSLKLKGRKHTSQGCMSSDVRTRLI